MTTMISISVNPRVGAGRASRRRNEGQGHRTIIMRGPSRSGDRPGQGVRPRLSRPHARPPRPLRRAARHRAGRRRGLDRLARVLGAAAVAADTVRVRSARRIDAVRRRARTRRGRRAAAAVGADRPRAGARHRPRDQGGQLRDRNRHHAAAPARQAHAGRRHADVAGHRRGLDVRGHEARAARQSGDSQHGARPAGRRDPRAARDGAGEPRGPLLSGHVFLRGRKHGRRAAEPRATRARRAARRGVGAPRRRTAAASRRTKR